MGSFSFGQGIDSWVSVLIFQGVIAVFVIGAMAASYIVSPKRRGPIKQSPYETGIPVTTPMRRRLNPHYYLIAILFLLFDVELVFFYPWAKLMGVLNEPAQKESLNTVFFGMLGFIGILLVGYIYALVKGVFKLR
jgi:NADH-quinone oxidoreductase subunit A